MRPFLCIPLVFGLALSLAPPASSQSLGAPIGEPVTFVPKPGTTLILEGQGPLRGTVEVRREGGNLTIVNELDLDEYVMGVREVPGMWEMEALKAQAVAARTYALWEKGNGYWQQFGFDTCATVSCQVYQGAAAERGERGRRWTQAVRETAGEVLFDEGAPILARYHSTSGGFTLPNEVVFPSDGARHYLRTVDDPFDEVSPLHRWEVSFPHADLERIFREAIGLQGTLDQVVADEDGRRVMLRTLGGELEMTTVRFRRVVSDTAPRIFGDRYPGRRSDGERLPATIPSSRFTVSKTEDSFVVHGRGWGHGVGMSQWGAKGRAEAGHSYREILGAYYGGIEPQQWTGGRTIRVAVVRGVSSARITADGDFSVHAGATDLAPSTVGGWSVVATGDRSIQVTPPTGYDLPLALTGVDAPEEVVVDPPEQGRTLDVGYVVPKAAEVTGVVTLEGEEVARHRTIAEAGEWTLGIPLDPGAIRGRQTYAVAMRAYDGVDTVEASFEVVLDRPGPGLLSRAVWVAAFLLLVALLLAWRRRRRPPPAQSSTIPSRGQLSPHG